MAWVLPVISAATAIYGAVKKNKSGGDSNTNEGINTISTMSPEQQQLMIGLGNYLQSQVGKGAAPYSGQTTAPLSTGEQAAYQKSLSNLEGAPTASATSGIAAFQNALKGMSEKDVYNQYMKYTAPLEAKTLKEQTIPTFKESMVPGGTLRSTGTESGIAKIISDYGANQLSRIGQRIQQERANALSVLPMTGTMSSLESRAPEMEAAASYGGIARAVEQAELTAKLQEFIRTSPEMSPLISQMLNYLNVGTMAAYNQPAETSPFMQILPSLIQAGGAVAGAYYGK